MNSYDTLTKAELSSILKQSNLPHTGSKNELLERVISLGPSPHDYKIHIELLTTLFKRIQHATSLDTLLREFGDFVVDEIEKEMKPHMKKEFNKYVEQYYTWREKHSNLTRNDTESITKALPIFIDNLGTTFPQYPEIQSIMQDGYHNLKRKKKTKTQKKKIKKHKKSHSSSTRKSQGGAPGSISVYTPQSLQHISLKFIVIIIVYLFSVWVATYYYLRNLSNNYQLDTTDMQEGFVEFIRGLFSQNCFRVIFDTLQERGYQFSNEVLYNVFNTLSILVFSIFSNSYSSFELRNFFQNNRNAQYINHIRVLFCDVALMGLFILASVYYGFRYITHIGSANTSRRQNIASDYYLFINHLVGMRWLVNISWRLLLGINRSQYNQSPAGITDTLTYLLSIGGTQSNTVFDEPGIDTLSISELLYLSVVHQAQGWLNLAPQSPAPQLTNSSSDTSDDDDDDDDDEGDDDKLKKLLSEYSKK
jgi:hypothetical protein